MQKLWYQLDDDDDDGYDYDNEYEMSTAGECIALVFLIPWLMFGTNLSMIDDLLQRPPKQGPTSIQLYIAVQGWAFQCFGHLTLVEKKLRLSKSQHVLLISGINIC